MAPPKKTRFIVTHVVTVDPGRDISLKDVRGYAALDCPDGTEAKLQSVKLLESPTPGKVAKKAAPKAPAKAAAKAPAKSTAKSGKGKAGKKA